MQLARGSSVALAGLLVGLGIAMFAKAVYQVGFRELTVEHMLGPGLVLVGLLRIRMQRMIDGGYTRAAGEPPTEGGDDGDTT
jgi:hypothetical protein